MVSLQSLRPIASYLSSVIFFCCEGISPLPLLQFWCDPRVLEDPEETGCLTLHLKLGHFWNARILVSTLPPLRDICYKSVWAEVLWKERIEEAFRDSVMCQSRRTESPWNLLVYWGKFCILTGQGEKKRIQLNLALRDVRTPADALVNLYIPCSTYRAFASKMVRGYPRNTTNKWMSWVYVLTWKAIKSHFYIFLCFFPLSGHIILDLSSDIISYSPNTLTTHPKTHLRRGWLVLSLRVRAVWPLLRPVIRASGATAPGRARVHSLDGAAGGIRARGPGEREGEWLCRKESATCLQVPAPPTGSPRLCQSGDPAWESGGQRAQMWPSQLWKDAGGVPRAGGAGPGALWGPGSLSSRWLSPCRPPLGLQDGSWQSHFLMGPGEGQGACRPLSLLTENIKGTRQGGEVSPERRWRCEDQNLLPCLLPAVTTHWS